MMAKLPFPLSLKSIEIERAIAEGRAEEAMHKLIAALQAPGDDRAVRLLAAKWIERVGLPGGAGKALRDGRPQLLEDWLDIAEMMRELQESQTYLDAVAMTAAHFGCSDRHVQKCVAAFNSARDDD